MFQCAYETFQCSVLLIGSSGNCNSIVPLEIILSEAPLEAPWQAAKSKMQLLEELIRVTLNLKPSHSKLV